MFILVIGLNLLLSVGCLGVAWQLWRLRQSLMLAVATLRAWEAAEAPRLAVDQTTEAILAGRQLTAASRQHYQQFQRQLRQLRQLLKLIGFLGQLWRFYRRRPLRRPRH